MTKERIANIREAITGMAVRQPHTGVFFIQDLERIIIELVTALENKDYTCPRCGAIVRLEGEDG